jgi:hypothetical protein
MNGPDPVVSVIWALPGVSATRLGIMKGTLTSGLPSAGNTSAVGSLSLSSKVLASRTVRVAPKVMSFWPTASRVAQRLIEATQSSAVTGRPSCHFNPSRRVKA